jgi:hypothetical protein
LTHYCIDTSALIAAWYERYKPNRFPKLWAQLDALIQGKRLLSSVMVLDECGRRSPELHEWLKDRADMFLVPDAEVQARVSTPKIGSSAKHEVTTRLAPRRTLTWTKGNRAEDPHIS